MEDLKFSVSICVYGGDDPVHFDTAMESIFNQTLKPDEVALVVDGPVGESIESVIQKYEKGFSTLKVIRSDVNLGHGNARRLGFENCTYELIALMDADDISVPDRFERQIEAFKENPRLSIVGGQINEFIGTEDNVVGRRTVPLSDADIKNYMKTRCPMNQVTVMFKKADVEKVGGYIDWYCEEDYYLWIRLFLAGCKFKNIDDCLVSVRVGEDMYMRRGGIKYFKSEARLQGFMLKKRIIGPVTYVVNVAKRLVVQVLLPNTLRAWVFKKFAREKSED